MADVTSIEIGGREHVCVSTDHIRVEIVPGLGGTIVSLRSTLRPETELLWRPPWAPRPAAAAALPGSADNLATDGLTGGWLTMFPNGSEAASVEGADWPAYGEARLTWCDWRQAGDAVILTGRLLRSPFELIKIVSIRDDEVTVEETVKNVGDEHVDVVWGSQVMFGEALLGPQTRLESRAALVRADARQTPSADYDDILPWPRAYTADGLVNLRSIPSGVASRTAYLSDFETPALSLSNPAVGLRVDLSWDGDIWPYVWYELETGAQLGYPWWGAARYLALTPNTSWPATGVGEVRRVSATSLRIQPGSTRTSQLAIRVGAA